MIEYINKIFPNQPPEIEEGNKEYKRNLLNEKLKKDFLNRRATQMKYRLLEGNGKAIYILGIEDCGRADGMNDKELKMTLQNIKKIADIINARINKIRIYKTIQKINKIATVRIVLDNYLDNFIIEF